MEFSQRKLPMEAAMELRVCPIRTVQAYALMLAPLYVFMRLNRKFVAVKAPMDFFTPEELARLVPFEQFYMPKFVDSALGFRDAARRVKALLNWTPAPPKHLSDDRYPPVALPPAPYEVSDAILRIIGPLWGKGTIVEPFFLSVFANEVCSLLPGEVLLRTRDRNIDLFETAIFQSSWAVFLALHLGFCDLGFLDRLRSRVFHEVTGEASDDSDRASEDGEMGEIVDLARASFGESRYAPLSGELFRSGDGRAAQKMIARLERVASQLIRPEAPVPTIFGPAGFVDG